MWCPACVPDTALPRGGKVLSRVPLTSLGGRKNIPRKSFFQTAQVARSIVKRCHKATRKAPERYLDPVTDVTSMWFLGGRRKRTAATQPGIKPTNFFQKLVCMWHHFPARLWRETDGRKWFSTKVLWCWCCIAYGCSTGSNQEIIKKFVSGTQYYCLQRGEKEKKVTRKYQKIPEKLLSGLCLWVERRLIMSVCVVTTFQKVTALLGALKDVGFLQIMYYSSTIFLSS